MKRVGFFSDLPHGDPSEPTVSESRDKLDDETARSIAPYLGSGAVVFPTLGTRSVDVLSSAHEDIGPLAILSDGTWAWPSDLAYYVSRYHVGLPDELIKDARRARWQVPALSDAEIASLAVELTGAPRS